MGNNQSRATQWAEEPAKRTGPICGAKAPNWPYKICNQDPGHKGDHCRRDIAGSAVVEFWWPREVPVAAV
jgi:hypothetical protein